MHFLLPVSFPKKPAGSQLLIGEHVGNSSKNGGSNGKKLTYQSPTPEIAKKSWPPSVKLRCTGGQAIVVWDAVHAELGVQVLEPRAHCVCRTWICKSRIYSSKPLYPHETQIRLAPDLKTAKRKQNNIDNISIDCSNGEMNKTSSPDSPTAVGLPRSTPHHHFRSLSSNQNPITHS